MKKYAKYKRWIVCLLVPILCFGLTGCSQPQEEEHDPTQVIENNNKQDIEFEDKDFKSDYSIIGGTKHPILWDSMASAVEYWAKAPAEKISIPKDDEKITDSTILIMYSAFGGETINGIDIRFSNSQQLEDFNFQEACKLAKFYVPKPEGIEYKKSYSVQGDGWTKYISGYEKVDEGYTFWFFTVITKNDNGKIERLEIIDGLPVELMDSQTETQEWEFNVYE